MLGMEKIHVGEIHNSSAHWVLGLPRVSWIGEIRIKKVFFPLVQGVI